MAEGESVEYKESSADKESLLRSVAAFANSRGGKIELGVNDKGEKIGVTIGKRTVEDLARWITEEIRPALYPSIEVKKINDKNTIEITISESPTKPHFYKGIAYVRVGRINKALEPHMLEQFLKKKLQGGFDEVQSHAQLEDVDEKKVIEFTNLMRYAGRKKVEYQELEHTLKALGVYLNKKLFNAAFMVFGKDPYTFFPQLSFRCVLRSGSEIRDYLFTSGTIFEIEKDVELFLERNLKRTVKIEKFERKEYLEVPVEALREAIFNSLIHRDYFHPSGNYLEITDGEVIVKNPGTLPEGLSLKDLYGRHDSIPTNKLIASLAYLAGKIEQWGEGTVKIVKEAAKAGLSKPIFKQERGFFYVIFKRTAIGKDAEQALMLFKKKRQVKSKDVASYMHVSERKARNILSSLASIGAIIKHGTTKGALYSTA